MRGTTIVTEGTTTTWEWHQLLIGWKASMCWPMKKVMTSSGKGDKLSQQQAMVAMTAPSLCMEYNTQQ